MDTTQQDTPKTGQEFETLIEPEASLPEITFEELPEPLRQSMARAGWQSLMPVQAKSLPYLLTGQDLMVQSRTGSGKTGAFLMPIFHLINLEKHQTQALVLCPTRELARQVAMDADTLFAGTGLKVCTVYGGVGYGEQTDALRAGAHLVIGTPGRVLDHLLRRNLTLEGIRVLVFDEADRMLSIGFYPDMKEVKRYLPKSRVSMFLFSATYPPHVLRLAEEFMDNPNFLSLSSSQVHVTDILHQYIEAPGMDKDRCLVRLLEIENPSSAIIFSNTKANVHYITEVLKGFGYDAEELSSDLSQAKRDEVLMRLRKKNLRFLVATDVAARGLDIPELSHVFQYETPEDPESYIHRAGRTGRAGASGTAITLVNIMEELAIKRIGQRFGIDLVKRAIPTDEDVSAVVAERLTALLEAELRTMPPLKKVRYQRFLPLVQDLVASDDAALLAMLLDERYQATLHGIPPEPEGAREQRAPHEPRRDREPRPARAPQSEREPRREASERSGERSKSSAPSKPAERQGVAPAPVQAGGEGEALAIPVAAGPGTGTHQAGQPGQPAEQGEAGEQKKKRRRRRRGKKKPTAEVSAAVEGDTGEGAGTPAVEAAVSEVQVSAKSEPKTRPSSEPRGRSRSGTAGKPREQSEAAAKPAPQDQAGIEPVDKAAPKKTVELEYKPDEFKGIEWD